MTLKQVSQELQDLRQGPHTTVTANEPQRGKKTSTTTILKLPNPMDGDEGRMARDRVQTATDNDNPAGILYAELPEITLQV